MTNVLIVDDEKIEREGLKYLLSREAKEQRTVFEAANGKQALQVLRCRGYPASSDRYQDAAHDRPGTFQESQRKNSRISRSSYSVVSATLPLRRKQSAMVSRNIS